MKIVKQIIFQHKLVDIINKGTSEEETNDLIPNNRIIARYVEGEEVDLISGDSIVETINIDEPSILIELKDMTTGNPDNVDLSKIGSKDLLEQLIFNINDKINV